MRSFSLNLGVFLLSLSIFRLFSRFLPGFSLCCFFHRLFSYLWRIEDAHTNDWLYTYTNISRYSLCTVVYVLHGSTMETNLWNGFTWHQSNDLLSAHCSMFTLNGTKRKKRTNKAAMNIAWQTTRLTPTDRDRECHFCHIAENEKTALFTKSIRIFIQI